jgi:pSer/pThr/pTyr-binding forkhead associated (FHA) protein
MTELWLKYTDQYGEMQRVAAAQEIFTVGRHPENDLCIPDSRLSREHIRIEQFSGAFYVSDSNSSNGTTLNGATLGGAVILKNGDRLNLGGAVEIKVEFGSEEKNAYLPTGIENATSNAYQDVVAPNVGTANQVSPNVQSTSAASGSNSIPIAFFWLAPVFGLLILIFAAGFFFLLGGKKEVAQTSEIELPTPRTRSSKTEDSPTDETPTPKKNNSAENSNAATNASDSVNTVSAPKTSADAEKVEQNAAAFLRRIAQSDPKAFLTGKQTEAVNAKIAAFKGSAALAENLKAVKKNQAQFETLASSKNLKAQFLATAALARIGNNRGDPLAIAQTMLPVLNELKITLDNKLADDNLLIIAAYERGAAGKPRSLQSTLEAISKTTQNVSPREIRTIWFLREKDKITATEFDFALQFLAIGTITQNPKDFNVAADAVTFN